ncbi:MAG: sugar phosphate nucleotidyltransferase [Patescibacteria group bacterium]|jgi:mannose-1-phosphate guanylyltransferase
MKIVILAGGGGTRLWPISRKNSPKQSQAFIDNKTLLQKTFDRVRRGFKLTDIFVSTNYQQLPLLQKQIPKLPRLNFIAESAKRDTAGAIGLAVAYIDKLYPRETMMTVGSDHFIKDEKSFIELVKLAEKIIKENHKQTALIAVRPTYPETGYGYIKVNKIFKQYGNNEVFYGEKFIEKPNLAKAKQYLRSWDYLWNTNMFCWRSDYLLDLFKLYLPKHYKILKRIQPALGTPKARPTILREFSKLPSISIDYGIMEKTKKIVVIPASFGWADIGHWRTVRDVLQKKPGMNVIRGKHIGSAENSLIYSYTKRVITTAGVKNLIIVDTEDALLVCPADAAQEVKKIVEELKNRNLKSLI